MSVTFKGLEKTLRAIGKAKSDAAPKVDEGLKKCAEVVYRKSQGYVPVDTGELKQSGKVVGNGKTGLGAAYSVVYAAPHAVVVHEDLQARHAEPTCAKYVTRAIRETRGTCASILKREMTYT